MWVDGVDPKHAGKRAQPYIGQTCVYRGLKLCAQGTIVVPKKQTILSGQFDLNDSYLTCDHMAELADKSALLKYANCLQW